MPTVKVTVIDANNYFEVQFLLFFKIVSLFLQNIDVLQFQILLFRLEPLVVVLGHI